MGRKANTKIKVHIELTEIDYQHLAVAAAKENLTVTEYVQQFSKIKAETAAMPLLPLTPHPAPLVEAPAAPPAQHSPQTAIESNADSATEHEKPRKRR